MRTLGNLLVFMLGPIALIQFFSYFSPSLAAASFTVLAISSCVMCCSDQHTSRNGDTVIAVGDSALALVLSIILIFILLMSMFGLDATVRVISDTVDGIVRGDEWLSLCSGAIRMMIAIPSIFVSLSAYRNMRGFSRSRAAYSYEY